MTVDGSSSRAPQRSSSTAVRRSPASTSPPTSEADSAGLAIGIADHLGWAIAVTASKDGAVVDRRRIELVEAGVPSAPIEHEAQALSSAAAVALVADVRASVERASVAALRDLSGSVAAPIAFVSLRTWPADFPTDIDALRRAPYNARADAVMYRQVLAEAAHALGWVVHLYDARTLLDVAAGLDGHRATLGPPWTKDHRVALAAALQATV